ncbi:HEAT repeat domain-containing protein [Candidatus Poribacteria bacterium]|nr:HEAT repeat domain-containing protein [Candidatus Poribacteria bacterium]
MNVKTTAKTAAELMESLRKHPEFLRREKERESQRKAFEAFLHAEERPLIDELGKIEVHVKSAWDLVNSPDSYTPAIPILMKHLKIPYHPKIKEGIVRALTVKEARGVAGPLLVEEFLNISSQNTMVEQDFKWVIGNALSVVADDEVFEEMVELVKDKGHGTAREMVVLALANMKDSRAVDVLIELLNDSEVAGHAIVALGKLKATKARDVIEPFLEHQKAWIRKEASRALTKIQKAQIQAQAGCTQRRKRS